MRPKPRQGPFSQVTGDPFSFPKAEGARAAVSLGVNSQDQDEKGKDGPVCRGGMRKLKGNEGLVRGHVKVSRWAPKKWEMSR